MSDRQIAQVAAAWWRKAVERPKFDALGDGPRDAPMEMASVLATLAVPKTDEAVFVAFEKTLADMLYSTHERYVGVDYGPDGFLADAAILAGLSERRFPWKTGMWINWTEGTVEVRHGYGAEIRTIYSTPSEGGTR